MPLVRIALRKGTTPAFRHDLGQAVCQAMREELPISETATLRRPGPAFPSPTRPPNHKKGRFRGLFQDGMKIRAAERSAAPRC
jgi:hypothetical protein